MGGARWTLAPLAQAGPAAPLAGPVVARAGIPARDRQKGRCYSQPSLCLPCCELSGLVPSLRRCGFLDGLGPTRRVLVIARRAITDAEHATVRQLDGKSLAIGSEGASLESERYGHNEAVAVIGCGRYRPRQNWAADELA